MDIWDIVELDARLQYTHQIHSNQAYAFPPHIHSMHSSLFAPKKGKKWNSQIDVVKFLLEIYSKINL